MIDLHIFCANDHELLAEPFSFGNFSYATNGHVCVRVPLDSNIKKGKPDSIDVEKLTYCEPNGTYKEFPEYKPTEKTGCDACLSTGFSSFCPECDGEGEVTFNNSFHSYECNCETCHGDGSVAGGTDKCRICGGSGLVNKERFPYVDVDDMRLNTNLLDLIKDLPNVKINTTSKEYATFVFDGGDGVVMPMHKD